MKLKEIKSFKEYQRAQSLERLDAIRHNNPCWLSITRPEKVRSKILFGETTNGKVKIYSC